MKITKQYLKQVIKEELEKIYENESNLMAVNIYELGKGINELIQQINANTYKASPQELEIAQKAILILRDKVLKPTIERNKSAPSDKATNHFSLADEATRQPATEASNLANQIKNESLKASLLHQIKSWIQFNATAMYATK
jgi:hypothetical protein